MVIINSVTLTTTKSMKPYSRHVCALPESVQMIRDVCSLPAGSCRIIIIIEVVTAAQLSGDAVDVVKVLNALLRWYITL
jgi:hypothetical protein